MPYKHCSYSINLFRYCKLFLLFIGLVLCDVQLSAQSFVAWNDGGTLAFASMLTTINGTYPGGTATVSNVGAGYDFQIGQEYNVSNLNGAVASEVFGTFGPNQNAPSKSLVFTFSTPVQIVSFSMHDIDRGSGWHDAFSFTGVTFTSVTTTGGVGASTTGTTVVPWDTGISAESATWFNSTNLVTGFSIDFIETNGLTHAILGYSLEIIAGQLIDIQGDTIVCLGDSVLLTSVYDSINHLWADMNAPSTIISSDSTIYVSPIATTTYAVYGTSDTAYHTIYVEDLIGAFSLGNDTTICEGQNVLLNGTALNATSYLWNDNSMNPTQLVDQTGNYWVTASNFCGSLIDSIEVIVIDLVQPFNLGNDTTICNGQSLVLNGTAQNATNYLWQDGSLNSTITADQSIVYWVEASNFCNTEVDSITVSVMNLVLPFSLGNDTTLCIGGSLLLDALAQNATGYLWQDNSTIQTQLVSQTGVYSVEASNMCNSEVDTVVVTLIELILDLGLDQQICPGDVVNLDAGNTGANYLWNTSSTNQTIDVINTGAYWVDVSLGICLVSDTVNVDVQLLSPAFDAPIREGCQPLDLSLGFIDQSTLNFGNIVDWIWSFGNGEFSNSQLPSVIYQESGVFDVSITITSNLGCIESTTSPSYITVFPKPTASFGYGSGVSLIYENTQFLNTSINSNQWEWDFGDEGMSSEENPIYEFVNPGAHTIILIATNEFGCIDTVEQILPIVSPPIIYASNAFTPNGDEFNNQWNVVVSEIDIYNFRLQIFNRWGEVIWISHDPDEGWDGTYAGNFVQDGVYIWVLDCSDLYTAENYTFTGHLTVFR